jgi:hypothetical protein
LLLLFYEIYKFINKLYKIQVKNKKSMKQIWTL